jgi:hypothetical protein
VGFISLGTRLLAPAVGVAVGAIASEIANGSRNQVGIPIGAAIAPLGAIIFDAAVLGWKPAERRSGWERLSPRVAIVNHKASVGLGAAF